MSETNIPIISQLQIIDNNEFPEITLIKPIEYNIEEITNSKIEELIPIKDFMNIPITSDIVALNVIIAFLTMATRRSNFTNEEHPKIQECIEIFGKKIIDSSVSNYLENIKSKTL